MLVSLANALHLTSGERKQFFWAGLGIPKGDIAYLNVSTDRVLREIYLTVEQFALPTMVIDSLGNLIVLNLGYLHILNLNQASVASFLSKLKGRRLNIMDILFAPEFEESHQLHVHTDEWFYSLIMRFRAVGLQYRTHQTWLKLLEDCQGYKRFSRRWLPFTHTADWEHQGHFMDNVTGHIKHPIYGDLQFKTASITYSISGHDVILYTCVPTDRHTTHKFTEIAESGGQGVIELLSKWNPP